MQIYLDELIFLNIVSDWAVLHITFLICGDKTDKVRFTLAVALGAVYSVLCVFFPVMSALIIKLSAGFLMVFIAGGSLERAVQQAVIFFAASCVLGGFLTAVGRHMPITVITVLFLIAVFVKYAAKYIAKAFKKQRTGPYKTAKIEGYDGKSAEVRVFIDTGNLLRDPITGKSVMIVNYEELIPLFDDGSFPVLAADIPVAAALNAPNGTRLIFYRDISGQSAPLIIWRPKCVTFDDNIKKDILIGVGKNITVGVFACKAIIGDT